MNKLIGLDLIDNNKYVVCPFCDSDAWFISSDYIQCFLCKTRFKNKKLVQGGNVFSINMNLKFLRDLYDAGVPIDSLGIEVL